MPQSPLFVLIFSLIALVGIGLNAIRRIGWTEATAALIVVPLDRAPRLPVHAGTSVPLLLSALESEVQKTLADRHAF